MTNQEFIRSNENFINACNFAGINPTSRQASKYRNKKGLAFSKSRDRVGFANWMRQRIMDQIAEGID